MTGTGIDLGRRGFLTGRVVARAHAVRPPWARETAVASACTGCGACVEACPQTIMSLDRDERPVLGFEAGECTFCGLCAQSCPEPVFDRALPAFEHVVAFGEACFARRGIVCQSCADACPETAIRFSPRIGGPALPVLAADRCTGCGACVSACPAQAIAVAAPVAEARHV